MFKASELCPRLHHLILELLVEAGLPGNVVNVLHTGREDAAAVTEALIAHRAIRKIEFVGSGAVGRAIGSMAGKHLKPVLMELGGKGAAVVLKDADLQNAAQKCIGGGEKCNKLQKPSACTNMELFDSPHPSRASLLFYRADSGREEHCRRFHRPPQTAGQRVASGLRSEHTHCPDGLQQTGRCQKQRGDFHSGRAGLCLGIFLEASDLDRYYRGHGHV